MFFNIIKRFVKKYEKLKNNEQIKILGINIYKFMNEKDYI